MKTPSESIRQTDRFHHTRAAKAGPNPAKSEPFSLKSASRGDQRRVFWLFIFSFSLVLVYGGCAKRAELQFIKAKAGNGDVRHTFLIRNATILRIN
jgi:hypothetical protein